MKIKIVDVNETMATIEIIMPDGRLFTFRKHLNKVDLSQPQLKPLGFAGKSFPEYISNEAEKVFNKIIAFIITCSIFRQNESKVSTTKGQLFKQDKLFSKFQYKKYIDIDALVVYSNK